MDSPGARGTISIVHERMEMAIGEIVGEFLPGIHHVSQSHEDNSRCLEIFARHCGHDWRKYTEVSSKPEIVMKRARNVPTRVEHAKNLVTKFDGLHIISLESGL